CGQGSVRDHEAIPCFSWGWVRLRWAASTGAARTARLGHAMIADRMIPPWAWRAPSPSRPPHLILRDGGCGIRLTGKPPGVHLLDVRRDGFGFLRLRGGIGLRLLLGQLARMHHDKAPFLLGEQSRAILHLDPTEHTVAMPAARRLVLRPSRLLHEEREPGVLLPPGFEFLLDSTGPRHQVT